MVAPVAAAALACLLAPGAIAHAEPPLWRARVGASEVVLFGSVHVLPPGLDWRTPKLDAKLKAAAGEVWFEVPMDAVAQAQAAKLALSRARLPEGERLSPSLSPEGRARLARIAGRYGLGDSIERMQPWMADVALSARYAETQGASRERGVEGEIDRSLPAAVPRRALETIAEQIALFADVPRSEQIASLEQTLSDIERDPGAYGRLVRAWAAGDTAAIARETDELRTATPGLYRRLVLERNRRWVKTIEGLLKQRRRVVMVVGVGHLVGPDSVPALLRRDGLKVEGP